MWNWFQYCIKRGKRKWPSSGTAVWGSSWGAAGQCCGQAAAGQRIVQQPTNILRFCCNGKLYHVLPLFALSIWNHCGNKTDSAACNSWPKKYDPVELAAAVLRWECSWPVVAGGQLLRSLKPEVEFLDKVNINSVTFFLVFMKWSFVLWIKINYWNAEVNAKMQIEEYSKSLKYFG